MRRIYVSRWDEQASEKCERALEILTKNGEMEREEAENLIYATHRFCADKDKMLAFCEEQTFLEVCENVKRIRLAVGKTFLARQKLQKKATAVNMLFESEKNKAACDAAKQLVQRMPKDCNVGLMVSDFPNLLLMDIDRLFSDFLLLRVQIDAAGRNFTKRSECFFQGTFV